MRPRRNPSDPRRWVGVMAALLAVAPARAADAPPEKQPAPEVRVDGAGWLRNRQLNRTVRLLLDVDKRTELDANALEDAVLVLLANQREAGFLRARVELRVGEKGKEERYRFASGQPPELPRRLRTTDARFTLEPGVRYWVDAVEMEGLSALPIDEAETFFRNERFLISSKAGRVYSPQRLERARRNLEEELRRRGYAQAAVRATVLRSDDRTGETDLALSIRQGALWRVAAVRLELPEEARAPTAQAEAERDLLSLRGRPYSEWWEQDAAQAARNAFYRAGFPDASVQVVAEPAEDRGGERQVAATVRVQPGPAVRLGQVRFERNERTRESILRRRVRAAEGAPFDPLALERARYRLARLGVFRSVELRAEAVAGTAEPEVRDVVFDLSEGRRWETSFLLGYGSYEQLRGGVEYRRFNLFGRGHASRLELMQSFKSTSADYDYTVPEIFGERVDGSAKLFGLRREEESFLREEFGLTVALRRSFRRAGIDGTLAYTFQSLRNRDNVLGSAPSDLPQARVASFDFTVERDRRDNPLRPQRGNRSYLRLEHASRALGGEVDYQRTELGATWHFPWETGRGWHLGLSHGVVTTLGAESDLELPVNKRFYPGGDASVRGYQSGEAAPRLPDGRFLGAKSYLLLNVEVEQAVAPSWAVVAFVDAVGTAAQLRDYPFEKVLVSAGLGLRYQTFLGPIRLEYGRNVNPRAQDPGGTLHLSVGFPF